jgi:hypothetical protein
VVHNGGTQGPRNGTPLEDPKTGIFWLRKRIPDDLRPLLGKREEKQRLGTRDPNEAKRVHAQALAERGERWANLRSGPRAFSEREAHELVAPAYEWWVNAHRDNPNDQKIWKSEHFGELWNYHDPSKYTDLPFAERNRRMDEDGYLDLITMEAFCREKADELLIQRGLKVDALSRQKIAKAFGAAIQRASLTLAKLAIGQLEALMGSPASPTRSQVGSQDAICSEPLKFEMLVAGWAAERRPMPKTVYEYKRVIRVLTGFLGHDDARRVSAKDLVAWKAKMIEAGLHPTGGKARSGSRDPSVGGRQSSAPDQPGNARHHRCENAGRRIEAGIRRCGGGNHSRGGAAGGRSRQTLGPLIGCLFRCPVIRDLPAQG